MTEPLGNELFSAPEPVDADRHRDPTTGLLPSQMLREAVALGREIRPPSPSATARSSRRASICAGRSRLPGTGELSARY